VAVLWVEVQDLATTFSLLFRFIKQRRHQQPRLDIVGLFLQATRKLFSSAETVASLSLLPDQV
jgi:hypothetical protein